MKNRKTNNYMSGDEIIKILLEIADGIEPYLDPIIDILFKIAHFIFPFLIKITIFLSPYVDYILDLEFTKKVGKYLYRGFIYGFIYLDHKIWFCMTFPDMAGDYILFTLGLDWESDYAFKISICLIPIILIYIYLEHNYKISRLITYTYINYKFLIKQYVGSIKKFIKNKIIIILLIIFGLFYVFG